jgi:hypothetical protein
MIDFERFWTFREKKQSQFTGRWTETQNTKMLNNFESTKCLIRNFLCAYAPLNLCSFKIGTDFEYMLFEKNIK